jgi:uncharacterized protein
MKAKKLVFILLITSTLILIYFLSQNILTSQDKQKIRTNTINNTGQKKDILIINQCQFEIEYARTEEEKSQGLSGKKQLANNTGMLFVYEQPGFYGFWMKDMNFPLDFVWILDNKVVDISKNVQPPKNSYIPKVMPKNKVNKVLEINAGKIDKCDIKIKNEVIIK